MDNIQLTLELPRTVFSALRQQPTDFVDSMRLAAAVKWYEMEMISQSKAAEIAGISRAEFLNELNRFQITPFQYSADELIQEVLHG